MTIEHLSLSGGCIWGLYQYGILKQLNKEGFWKIEDIKSITATSVGSIVATVFILKIEFESMDTYLIDRPWDIVINGSTYNILEAFNACGLMNKQCFYDLFLPLFKSRDIDINITLSEFYKYSGIDFYIYASELNNFEAIEFHHSTYPDWKLIDVIYASCTLPTIFSPIIERNKCYIDGGLFNNYPVINTLKRVTDHDTILGICIDPQMPNDESTMITENSSIIDFTGILIRKVLKNVIVVCNNTGIIKYEIITFTDETTIGIMKKVANSREYRKQLIEDGEKEGLFYFRKWEEEQKEQKDKSS